ncbi:MBL fold metallo-hydrolase [Alkalihalobacillus sp. 1P02AB]|uniref:MBL fold metallo-hydrolase n=1 Tax=Alkalihalobacillus sp. 1P02AB TaxID=3132260 RepID=UPI0039A67B6C
MLTKVVDDIYLVKVRFPFGIREVNCYLFKGERGYTLVDTGSEAEESIQLWTDILSKGIIIEKIVLTHVHPDHVGLARWFQENHQLPVHLSTVGNEELKMIQNDHIKEEDLENIICENGAPSIPTEMLSLDPSPYYFTPDVLFEIGEFIQLGDDEYEVIWTPGHSTDHMCFYQREKQILVVGDHVLKDISPIIYFSLSNKEEDSMKHYFQSLDLIRNYPTKLCLPGHGEVFSNLIERVDELKKGHEHRIEQMLHCLKSDWKTATEVCTEIYQPKKKTHFFSPFISTIARFKYLVSEGMVDYYTENGIRYYRAKSE